MTLFIVVFVSQYNVIIVVYRDNLKLSYLRNCRWNSYKRPTSNSYEHEERTLQVSIWIVNQILQDKAVKATLIQRQCTSLTIVMTIGSGSQSHLNNRHLRRDGASGHGFGMARGNDFRLLPQILIATDDNPGDKRRLHHPGNPTNSLALS